MGLSNSSSISLVSLLVIVLMTLSHIHGLPELLFLLLFVFEETCNKPRLSSDTVEALSMLALLMLVTLASGSFHVGIQLPEASAALVMCHSMSSCSRYLQIYVNQN